MTSLSDDHRGTREPDSLWRRIIFELLEVAVFDLFHKTFSAEKVGVKLSGELSGNHKKLVVDHFRKRNGAAYGDKMHTPLEHEAKVPEDKDGEGRGSGSEGSSGRTEKLSEAIKEYAKAENEESCERNEKAIAVGRDARPIGIDGNEKIEGHHASEKRDPDLGQAECKEEQSEDRQSEERSPREQPVIGGEQHTKKDRGSPEKIADRDIARLERSTIHNPAGDKRRNHHEADH